MIGIVDYGLGNVLAFENVYKRLNIDVTIVRQADDLRHVSKLILPGVGAFDHAMDLLDRSGMRQSLDELVLSAGMPVLGVCVGMQMLAHSSDEGRSPGLGWIDGRVKKLRSLQVTPLPLPHMGWNDVMPVSTTELFTGLEADARFYFLHSYFFDCEREEHVVAVSSYGGDFSCAVHAANIYGVQFHPEKSHHYGTQLLQNFARI